MAIRILDVGQCGFDGPQMAALWRSKLGATVVTAADGADAARRLAKAAYDIVLVNRILAADGASGLDVIKDLLKSKPAVPVMLVSDLPKAQDAAVALGAVRGFGKSDINKQSTLDLVKHATGSKPNGRQDKKK